MYSHTCTSVTGPYLHVLVKRFPAILHLTAAFHSAAERTVKTLIHTGAMRINTQLAGSQPISGLLQWGNGGQRCARADEL